MRAVVFAGPTVTRKDIETGNGVEWRPPARQGDVLRATRERPVAIGIVDGYFERVPAVWHKEVLYALSTGVHVLGAASMGALRAAELYHFGMEGVGEVFDAYRRRLLEDDDEVAVAHADAEAGYRAISESMVNVRATVLRAEAEGVLDSGAGTRLMRAAKDLFYAERSYPRAAVLAGFDDEATARFLGWLPGGRVDVKRRDALLMLRRMSDLVADGQPHSPRFKFERTLFWDQMVKEGPA